MISWSRKAVGEEFPLHDHDFPEVFWISEGVMQHLINGTTTELKRGDLVFVRAKDGHAFCGAGERGGVVCNFAVRPDVVRHLRERYFPTLASAWWDAAAVPSCLQLSAAELQTLDHSARDFAEGSVPDLHATERFLLNLFHLLRKRESPAPDSLEPAWLVAARKAMEEPKNLSAGVPKLVRLCGCSAEHLARTVRRIHGTTPTGLVNELRINWTAAELQFSSREIAEIALAAGFESLSHYYHLFRQQLGVTPRKFRLRARTLA
jgi:AraC family transcriptional regulator, dual regulator of chb operon